MPQNLKTWSLENRLKNSEVYIIIGEAISNFEEPYPNPHYIVEIDAANSCRKYRFIYMQCKHIRKERDCELDLTVNQSVEQVSGRIMDNNKILTHWNRLALLNTKIDAIELKIAEEEKLRDRMKKVIAEVKSEEGAGRNEKEATTQPVDEQFCRAENDCEANVPNIPEIELQIADLHDEIDMLSVFLADRRRVLEAEQHRI